jgi:hypothetical protein
VGKRRFVRLLPERASLAYNAGEAPDDMSAIQARPPYVEPLGGAASPTVSVVDTITTARSTPARPHEQRLRPPLYWTGVAAIRRTIYLTCLMERCVGGGEPV